MQNLIGIGVADAAEEPRVGERPLQGVVVLAKHGDEIAGRGIEHLEAARLMASQFRFASDDMQGGASLRAGLGESQRAIGKVERGEPELARQLRSRRLPVQPARY